VRCSKGTYVRALARDLGERLGTGASLNGLVRLRVGPFRLEESVTLAELEADPARWLLPPDAALADLRAVVLGSSEQGHFRHGRDWHGGDVPSGPVRAYAAGGELVGLIEASGGRLRPRFSLLD
jgi:tRNA pseudouridine55 synthase